MKAINNIDPEATMQTIEQTLAELREGFNPTALTKTERKENRCQSEFNSAERKDGGSLTTQLWFLALRNGAIHSRWMMPPTISNQIH